jgi:transcriptional regulator with XRE-family HTH domain
VAGIINGELLRQLREQKGWSQRDLSVAAHIDPSVVSRLERGLQSDVKLSVVIPIATALEVSIDLLVGQSRSPHPGLIPELESIMQQFDDESIEIQRYAAGILQGLLSVSNKSPKP